MKDVFTLEAELRSDKGKGASRRLRRAHKVPGIVYGGHAEPTPIAVDHRELAKHLEHESFYSHVIELRIGERTERVVLKDLQRHPAKPLVLHVDFQRVVAGETIRVHVPLHFVNESQAPGVRAGGIVSHHLAEVEVECTPENLPEFIEVDLSGLELGGLIHLSELELPPGVELYALRHGGVDEVVVSVHGRGPVEEAGEEAGEEEEA
ncbi:50S ribosomal protein L25/general stress protein Ctc [Inmirania thermothiophila]|uniref:Large ribosomal subunit protein bL25 n=1 Tax=Inmirania thermothiophila TaxID=1750597 RepID=A0A3N1YBP1_9GAMM|nr:50S ribosomal protein L25/general stress protein Ctc [Inmirania thermothiophila]ROR34807.1 LSU ribosomal protein L25P [Inmirania thermothiophila]